MKPSTTVSTLLALLKHFTADQTEVLLKAENLLKLHLHFGVSEEQLKAKIRDGQVPGTLLLALAEQHGADALWDLLSPREQALGQTVSTVPAVKHVDADFLRTDLQAGLVGGRSLAGLVVLLAGYTFAVMFIADLPPGLGCGFSWPVVAAVLLISGIGGAIMLTEARGIGALTAAFGAFITCVIAGMWPASFRDQPEFLQICCIEAPGLLIGVLLALFLRGQFDEKPSRF